VCVIVSYMKIGFTGTQKGMTKAQKAMVTGLLYTEQIEIAHHGGCIGADTEFDDICYRKLPRAVIIIIHPSNIKAKQGRCHMAMYLREEKEPLVRNHDIVDGCDIVIACPHESFEIIRSGTWATIRYARKVGKKVIVVYPDGRIE